MERWDDGEVDSWFGGLKDLRNEGKESWKECEESEVEELLIEEWRRWKNRARWRR